MAGFLLGALATLVAGSKDVGKLQW